MYIRFLGAFRPTNGSLQDSLRYKLSRTSEIACEKVKKNMPAVKQAKVGLLVNPKAVVKHFNGDCWSEYDSNGRLFKTRNPKESTQHSECWAKPEFTGIVVTTGYRKNEGFDNLSTVAKTAIIEIAETHQLPVYNLTGKGLVQIY